MLNYKDLKKFISSNDNKINIESLIVVLNKKNNTFFIIGSASNLNIDTFSFTTKRDGLLFQDIKSNSGKVDSTGVMCIMTHYQTCKLSDEIKVDRKSNYRNICHNNSFDGDKFMTVDKFMTTRKFDDNALLTVAFDNKGKHTFALADSFEILENPKFTMTDSYGHKSPHEYEFNCIAIVVGDHMTREYIKENVTTILKFDEYKLLDHIKLFENFDKYNFGSYDGKSVNLNEYRRSIEKNLCEFDNHDINVVSALLYGVDYMYGDKKFRIYTNTNITYTICSLGDYCYVTIKDYDVNAINIDVIDGFDELRQVVSCIVDEVELMAENDDKDYTDQDDEDDNYNY